MSAVLEYFQRTSRRPSRMDIFQCVMEIGEVLMY